MAQHTPLRRRFPDRPTTLWGRSTVKRHLRLPELPRARGVWAIAAVRNEADVIGASIDHLLDQGVTRVLAVDHMSSDDTPTVMAERSRFVTVVPYRTDAFYQGTIMTALARHAADFGADWIVPFDADEIWWTDDGTPLAEHLLSRDDDVVRGTWWNYLPTATDAVEENPFRRLTHRGDAPEQLAKVAFRAAPKITVLEGNHGVSPARSVGDGLVIAHYPYRSPDQFIRKMVQGNAALVASRLPETVITHWRELGVLDAAQLTQIWDDFVESHELPYSGWRTPSTLVEDPDARQLRSANLKDGSVELTPDS